MKIIHKRGASETLSDADEGVVTIRNTLKLIEKQMEDLNQQIEDFTARAKTHLSRKQDVLAKKCLRSRKALSTLLQQRADSHYQLETVLLRLQHVETESEVFF